MKKLTILIATILVFALTMSTFADSFSDVPENHWAYEAIVELYNLGIYEGYPDGTFKGDNALTRYEMAMVITRTLENINEEREESLTKIEALEEEMADLQMSLKGTEQLADLRDSITQKEIDEINEKLEDAMTKLETIEAIQSDLDDLEMSLKGTEQLADLRNTVMEQEMDGMKEDIEELEALKEQVAAIEEKLGDKVDVDTIASIEEKIESIKKSGLNTEQAQDVTAIVRAMIKENDLAQTEEVGKTQETIENLQALIDEFATELDDIEMSLKGTEQLADLRHIIMEERVDELDESVADLDERVSDLEEPVVSFSGKYGVNLSSVAIYGDALEAEESETYYYEDPYDAQSGWYKDQVDASTDHEYSGDPDYRLTDEGDYYDHEYTFNNTLDLNVGVNKGPLSADINMTAMSNVFGLAADGTDYELDSLEGTIATPDFTATIKDGQEVNFKDYMYDEASVDGVVVEAGDNVYFLAMSVEEFKRYHDDVDGAEDDYNSFKRDNIFFGAKSSIDLLLPINVYVGYEFADEETHTFPDAGVTETFDRVQTTLIGLDTATEMAGFDITSDLAFNLGETSNNGHLFRVGATGDMAMLGVKFNYENTQDMLLIENSAAADKEGYDLKLSSSLGPVEGSFTRENYGTVVNTINAKVPEGEVAFAGIDVDGNYELTTGADDRHKEIRNINASTDMAGIELGYTYDYDGDNEIYDPTKDRVDNANNLVAGDAGFADEASEADADTNKHTFDATYGMGAFTLGATAEMAKGIVDDDVDIVWENQFSNTYTFTGDYESGPITAGVKHVIGGNTTLTGRYTQDMYEAGFKKVLAGDLTIDGSVTAPTLTLVGVDIDSNACFKRNINQNTQNLELNVDATKDVSDKLDLTGSATWADKEIGVDFAGQKTVLGAGVEYTITDDISATADYKNMSFDADSGESYKVSEATAGVSIAF